MRKIIKPSRPDIRWKYDINKRSRHQKNLASLCLKIPVRFSTPQTRPGLDHYVFHLSNYGYWLDYCLPLTLDIIVTAVKGSTVFLIMEEVCLKKSPWSKVAAVWSLSVTSCHCACTKRPMFDRTVSPSSNKVSHIQSQKWYNATVLKNWNRGRWRKLSI